jgi:hypothetical protein
VQGGWSQWDVRGCIPMSSASGLCVWCASGAGSGV